MARTVTTPCDLLHKFGAKTGEQLKAKGKWNISSSQQLQHLVISPPNQAKLKADEKHVALKKFYSSQ